MKKWILILMAAIAFGGTPAVQAAPASGYSQFLQSLDGIVTGAVIPVAEDMALAAPAGLTAGTVNIAKGFLGSRVVWGGANPGQGFDCSGLVQYVFRQAGVELPRTADLQFLVGRTVARTALRPGDLVYFTTYAPGASHVGIYIGMDKFVHTSFSQGVVALGDMNDPYFAQRYYGAKRVL
ncbi:MAG: C40 family peptidase [Negativicutes bacterium]|nr:C40 family peptidase [Negativicutes bacterium]